MNTLKQFNIPHIKLSLGTHHFDFEVNDAFFSHFEESEIHKADVKVGIELLKESSMMVLEFSIRGKAEVVCDRCLDTFYLPLDNHYRLIVKFGDDYQEQSDEVIIIPMGDSPLYLGQIIYEYLHLSLPIKKVHPEDANGQSGCNPAIMEALKQYTKTTEQNGEDKDQEEKDHTNKQGDPRWDALRNLKFN